MKSPLSSNLVSLIERAINNCYYNGDPSAEDGNGIAVFAEWVDSKRDG